VDRGSRYGPDGGPEVDEDRFCEIWNHVFMQHRVDGACELLGDLPNKNIDTGSSVERVAMVLQDKASFFETDLFAPLLDEVQSLSGKHYGADEKHDVAIRIVGEHARATAFLVADGVQPSNEGRGYILRRMLRRVVSASRRLGAQREVFRPLVARVVDGFGDAYPELRENRAFIEEVLASEEDRFSATLRQGMVLFDEARDHAAAGTVTGADAFKLSDTFGFPIELTIELAADAGLQVDEESFHVLLQEQKDRARAAAKKVEIGLDAGAVPPTIFVGYEQPEAEAPITLLLNDENAELEVAEEGQAVRLFLERTPFYAEGGGQVGDRGVIRTHTGSVRITDTQKAGDHAIVHEGVVENGEVRAGQDAIGEIDRLYREGTARAHTSTHVIHATLRHILGEHARQAGSLIEPGRLRFDFSHPSSVPIEVLEQAELEANRRLAQDDVVRVFETSMDEAQALGATALFGEKYGSIVRVVEIGDYSRELCGGTHVGRTGTVAVIRLLREGSIGAGMRRIEALVGPDALREINVERALLRDLLGVLDAKDPRAALERARKVVDDNKRMRNELGKLRAGGRDQLVAGLADGARDVDGVALVTAEVPDLDPGELRELALKVRDRLQDRPAVIVVGNGAGGKAMLVAAATTGAIARGATAPAVLTDAAAAVGGGAGGKDQLANAGGTRAERVPDALGTIPARLAALLAGA
jgi:alanyl-tRNA synthetase